jgi:hypothetical protein
MAIGVRVIAYSARLTGLGPGARLSHKSCLHYFEMC